jgi:hypothetical protein
VLVVGRPIRSSLEQRGGRVGRPAASDDIQLWPWRADIDGVRGVGLVVVLITLAVAGALYAKQSKTQGPTAAAATQEEALARTTAAAAMFSQVDQVLQADYAQSGTYLGAQLPAGSGVVLAQASAASYCLTANVNGTLMHETGPGGSPVPGAC